MVFQQISIWQNRTQFATSDKLMQSWDSGSRYESPIGLQWWFIIGYLRTWQDSSNNGAHWQSHRTRSGMELRMRVTYLLYLEMFAIQESFVHAHRWPWRWFAFFATAMVPSNGEVLKHRSTNKINFKVAKSRDWSQGRDAERTFLVSLRVWGLSWFETAFCQRLYFTQIISFESLHYFTFVSPSCQSRNWAFPVDGSYAGLEQPCGFASPGVYRHHHWVQPVVIRCLSVHKHRCHEPAKSFSILSPIYVIVIRTVILAKSKHIIITRICMDQ